MIPARSAGRLIFFLSIESKHMTTSTIPHRTVALPPIGTYLPHLRGAFWGLQRAKPDSGLADYALLVPQGPQFEARSTAWGSYGKDEPGASCQWDGLANTTALLASENDHPMLQLLRDPATPAEDLQGLYLPSLRELKTLFANGCDQFDPDRWYWSSTQFSRHPAFYQLFGNGDTDTFVNSWERGCARFVRRSSIESLIGVTA